MLKRYAIRRDKDNYAFIEKAVFPPRLSEWTREVEDAQLFEFEYEAKECADFIQKHAFYCEIFEIEVDQTDHRIAAQQRRWQKASDMVCDKWEIERTRIEIKE